SLMAGLLLTLSCISSPSYRPLSSHWSLLHSLMATVHLGNVNSSLTAGLLLTPSCISCQFLLLSHQPLLHLPMPAILGEVPVNTSLIQDSC
ncbi:hypothetical protein V8E55_002913, partial [Tylopilus felleus]